ncbi:glycosyltransferase 61 family protein [Paracoccus aestuariivivens]|uniref:DUF563 domain-containing protein n=1 Tax=Paracoccus aestuariivivens TaxID=1820333 RepID=A0A6L6J9M3_9RHOB|nr:glycosyltransferase family 61 protein [Paracoccus aestuariivivens]MTH77808.1 DUF563 domain-containing protein [Paracoccus aestuariivivens]
MDLDLRHMPMDAFHMPSIHAGMYYLPPRPGWIMRPVPAARIEMFAASDDGAMFDLQQALIDEKQERLPKLAVEIKSAPVVLTDAEFDQSFATINGRYWLNGAAGDRLRHRYDLQNYGPWNRDRQAVAFRQGRLGPPYQPPVWRQPSDDLEIAIELRNGYNYYHFSVETLGVLAHFIGDETGQPINIHLRRGKQRGFVADFIEALFPELFPRVRFLTGPRQYAAVRSVFNHRHYVYQANDKRIDEGFGKAPDLNPDASFGETIEGRRELFCASFDTSLRLLRERALQQMPRNLLSTLPRMVWMDRDEKGDARKRGLSGERPLLEALRERGFQSVCFEHLSPLEQIASMQAADIVVAPHGAGLANMIYARPDTLVIEIGTRQTQLARWGDFLSQAHVSGCRYATVFADVLGIDDQESVPTIAESHLGIRIGQRATDRILELVDLRLKQNGSGSAGGPESTG